VDLDDHPRSTPSWYQLAQGEHADGLEGTLANDSRAGSSGREGRGEDSSSRIEKHAAKQPQAQGREPHETHARDSPHTYGARADDRSVQVPSKDLELSREIRLWRIIDPGLTEVDDPGATNDERPQKGLDRVGAPVETPVCTRPPSPGAQLRP